MLGLSDGGAHVDLFCDAGYCTELLGNWVREKQRLSLELAVKRITSEAGRFLRAQGPRPPAARATRPTSRSSIPIPLAPIPSIPRCASTCPAAAAAWSSPAQGIEYTVVNGQVLYEHQKPNECLPGQVLRSGVNSSRGITCTPLPRSPIRGSGASVIGLHRMKIPRKLDLSLLRHGCRIAILPDCDRWALPIRGAAESVQKPT